MNPTTQEQKRNQRSIDSKSHSSRSEKFCSASKSLKAFEGSLRKNDSSKSKDDAYNSPLKKRLTFGKSDQPESQSQGQKFFVDTTKKIKRVESPFQEKPKNYQIFPDKIQASQANLFLSCFQSISEKVDGQSSIEKQKLKSNHSPMVQDNQNVHHQQKIFAQDENLLKNQELKDLQIAAFHESSQSLMEIQISKQEEQMMEIQAINEPQQKSSQLIQSQSIMQNSSITSQLKSRSSETIRLRRKEMKIKKRKEKKNLAKKIKFKLRNITNFVDELHQKKPHTSHKELASELSEHLCEKKFSRLRKELKKLI